MKKVLLVRTKEKYHDESKIKVFIDGKLIGKLKRKEQKEISIDKDTIEVYAQTMYLYRSPKTTIKCEDNSVIELTKNPSTYFSPILFIVPFIPFYVPIMTKSEGFYIKLIASVVMLTLLILSVRQGYRTLKKGIIIKKR